MRKLVLLLELLGVAGCADDPHKIVCVQNEGKAPMDYKYSVSDRLYQGTLVSGNALCVPGGVSITIRGWE